MLCVVIPSNYEQLPNADGKRIVSIYIAFEYWHRNGTSQVWFDGRLAPVQKLLPRLVRFNLGDEWRISARTRVGKCAFASNPVTSRR
jgi:hypothetical protein